MVQNQQNNQENIFLAITWQRIKDPHAVTNPNLQADVPTFNKEIYGHPSNLSVQSTKIPSINKNTSGLCKCPNR